MQVVRLSSPSARLTRRVKPRSVNSAPGLFDGRLDHLIVAALDQHVGDRAAQGLAGRNRHQMRLALAARILDQGLVVEPHRLRQHRACHLDDVIESQRADRERRGGVDRGETVGQQHLGRGFDVIDQALEDIVEQPDLFVRIVHRAVDEEIGHPAQGLDPAGDGPVRKRGLQFVEQTSGGGERLGGFRNHDSVLEQKPATDSPPPELKYVGSGAGNAVASLCLGCIKRAVGAREKYVRRFVRIQRCNACRHRHLHAGRECAPVEIGNDGAQPVERPHGAGRCPCRAAPAGIPRRRSGRTGRRCGCWRTW